MAVVATMRDKPGPMPGEVLLSLPPPCGHVSQSTGSIEIIAQNRLRRVQQKPAYIAYYSPYEHNI